MSTTPTPVYYSHNEEYLLQNADSIRSLPQPGVLEQIQSYISQKYNPGPFWYAIYQVFPAFRLLRPKERSEYDLMALWGDFLAGVTLSTVLIPQALSYATLAGLPPQYGLFPSFICPIIYFLCGSCLQLSVGPFALVSIVIGDMINQGYPHLADIIDPVEQLQERMVYTMTLTLIAGLYLFIFAVLKLGWLVDFVSNPAVNALVMATALSVSASQFGALFGIKLANSESALASTISLFRGILDTNFLALFIGIAGICFLFWIELFGQKKQWKIPFPSHISLVIFVTIISAIFNLHKHFGLKIVGEIKMGFVPSVFPSFSAIGDNPSFYFINGFLVGLVCFVISASVGQAMAEQYRYKVNYNSELLSLALCSIIGAFTNSYTSSASLSRTSVVSSCKPKTQLHNLFTALVLLAVIFVVAPLLHHLPQTVLAAVVIGSFRGQFMKYTQGFETFSASPTEGMVYFLTLGATLFGSVQIGLVVAFLSSLLSVILKLSSFKPLYLIQVPSNQRFIHFKRLTKDTNYYDYLDSVESVGGLHKLQTAASTSTHVSYEPHTDSEDGYTHNITPTPNIITNDPRVIVLHIGQPITFLNQNPIQEFLTRYLDMFENYTARHNPDSTSDPFTIPITPLSEAQITVGATNDPNASLGYELLHVQYLRETMTNRFDTNSSHTSPTYHKNNEAFASQNGVFTYDLISNNVQEHSTQPLTQRHHGYHLNLIQPSPTVGQELLSQEISADQYHLLNAMLYTTVNAVKDDVISKFQCVIILDMVIEVDLTAQKMLAALKKAYPHVLILFSNPSQRMIHKYLIKQPAPICFVNHNIYLTVLFAKYILDIAVATRILNKKNDAITQE